MQGTLRSNKSLLKLNTSGVTHITGMSIMKDVLAGNTDRGGIKLNSQRSKIHEKEESVVN